MRKIAFALAIFMSGAIVFTGCKREEDPPAPAKVTYNKDIKTILTGSCGPCHLPGSAANANKWDDYATAKAKITSILDRVQRTPGSTGFMPRGASAQIPQASIDKLKQWVTDGLLEN